MPVLTRSQRASVEALREALALAASDPDKARRTIRVAAVLTRALGIIDLRPVLVGGGAVEFYTAADYQTEDIDLLVPSRPDVTEIMEALDFDRRGRDFHHRALDLFVEFPGAALQPGEEAVGVVVDGVETLVVSIEDLILDRLRAFVHWRSLRDALNVLSLLRSGRVVDRDRVVGRARKEGILRHWTSLSALGCREPIDRDRIDGELREILDAKDD